jgi:TonB family protein
MIKSSVVFVIACLVLPGWAQESQPDETKPNAPGLEFRRQFTVSRADAWEQIYGLVRELKLGVEKEDEHNGLLITDWVKLGASKSRPDLPSGKRKEGFTRGQFKLNVFVSPLHEPAVVQINAIVRLEDHFGARSVALGSGMTEQWFFDRLEQRLGEEGQLYTRSSAACKPVAPVTTTTEPIKSNETAGITPPELLYKESPIYPLADRNEGNRGAVIVRIIVDELGTVNTVTLLKEPSGRQLVAAAAQAVRLWRYRPGVRGGCPVPVYVTVTVNFLTR